MRKNFRLYAIALVATVFVASLSCEAEAAAPSAEATPAQSEASDATTIPSTAQPVSSPVSTESPSSDPGESGSETPVPVPTATPTTAHALPTEQPSSSGQGVVESMFGPISCDPSVSNVELTHNIYEPDAFDALVPMGRMWGSHVTPTDHLYVHLYEERERGFVRTPASGTVMHIQRFPNDQSPFWDNTLVEPDIRVVIAHSCTLFSIFIHLGELAPEIIEVTGEIERGQSWSPGPGQDISLEAGDPVALLGGSAVDYSLHDETVVLAGFQVPSHYQGEPWKVHTVDPFDYMTEELAAELLAKNERQVEPYGGQIDYDILGTAVGNWFMEGTVDYSGNGMFSNGEYWTGHLSIAYDHVDPSQIRISIGRNIGLTQDNCRICGGVYAVKGNRPDPATVTADSGIVRYELTGRRHSVAESRERTESDGVVLGTFLVQVLDDSSIRTEFFKGASADEVEGFTNSSVLYRR